MSRYYTAYLFAGSLLLLATTAHAQTTFQVGPRVGLNLTNCHFTGLYSTTPSAVRPGFEAGLTGSVAVGHWALQPAVLFTQKGYTTHGSGITIDWPITYDEDVRYQYLIAPVNVAYTQHKNGQGVQVFGGGYVGVLVGGHYSGENHYFMTYQPDSPSRDVAYSGKIIGGGNAADYPDRHVQQVDYGLQTGVGYRYGGLLFQAGYSLGLRNMGVDAIRSGYTYSSPTQYNRAFQASLAFLFGSRS